MLTFGGAASNLAAWEGPLIYWGIDLLFHKNIHIQFYLKLVFAKKIKKKITKKFFETDNFFSKFQEENFIWLTLSSTSPNPKVSSCSL